MKYTPLICLLWVWVACQPGQPSADTHTVAAPAVPLITDTGLPYAHIGLEIASVWPEGYQDEQVQDTVTTAGGYEWVSRTLIHDTGKVVLEGTPVSAGGLTDSMMNLSRINRIQISSPRYRTRLGLHVGSTVADIRQAIPDTALIVTPIPAYDMIEIWSPGTHIYYLVPAQGQTPQGLDALPPETPVSLIVVM
ncbi:MAG: hypothetical protein SF053_05560 [Bacteroidia bacterium]|nr:hypothetical protein [Bacteroidia bacterium]